MRMYLAAGIAAVVVSIVVVGLAPAGDVVSSGPKVGTYVGRFEVEDITGPNKGSFLCYRCQYSLSPVVCVFARSTSESLASLIKQIDGKISANAELKSFVVLFGRNDENAPEELTKLAAKAGVKNVPLTLSPGPNGPGGYSISKDADVTVVMWHKNIVKSSLAYKGELTDKDRDAILAEIPKILTR